MHGLNLDLAATKTGWGPLLIINVTMLRLFAPQSDIFLNWFP